MNLRVLFRRQAHVRNARSDKASELARLEMAASRGAATRLSIITPRPRGETTQFGFIIRNAAAGPETHLPSFDLLSRPVRSCAACAKSHIGGLHRLLVS